MNKNRRIALLLAVLFCLSAVTFVAVAKYIKDVPFQGNVTFTAALAESLTLSESEAARQTDGTYSLDADKPVENNSYTLMPGVDVPKDPTITITGKTAIPAYLYVEVCSNLPDAVTYEMEEHWNLLTDVTGPNGGKVYVYCNELDGTAIVLTGGDKISISILKNDTLKVSQTLLRDTTATMTFYGYMAQQVSAQDETTAFTTNFLPAP